MSAARHARNPITAVRARTRRLSIHQSSASAGRINASASRTLTMKIRLHREQEADRVGVDDHQVEEIGGHPDDVVFEPRHQDQDDDHRQRERRRDGRAGATGRARKVEHAPRQAEDELRHEARFAPEHEGRVPPGAAPRSARSATCGAASPHPAPSGGWSEMQGTAAWRQPVPGNDHPNARHTDTRHKSALILSFQGHITR